MAQRNFALRICIAQAVIALSATSVLSAPARLNEARAVESHLSARNFYWQCPQGQYFTGNPPPSTNPGACTGCQPGTFSSDGVNCYKTPMGFYNDVAGAKNPIGCLPGSYTDSTGSTVCKACTAPMMSYAASTQCIACADGLTSNDGQYCVPCPDGTSSKGGSVCSGGNYHILVRDASDKNSMGYLSMREVKYGVYYIADLANALTITSPTLGAAGPVPLIATNEAGHSGYNLAAALGGFGYDFSSSSDSYVWITESASDTKNEYFASNDDSPFGKAEPNVWVLGTADASGRIPISLNFVGPDQSIITCARFFDFVALSTTLVGATCADVGVFGSLDTTVVSFPRLLCQCRDIMN